MGIYPKKSPGSSVKLSVLEETNSMDATDGVTEKRRYLINRPRMIGPVTWILQLSTLMNQLGLEGRRIMSIAVLADGSVDFTTRRKGMWTK